MDSRMGSINEPFFNQENHDFLEDDHLDIDLKKRNLTNPLTLGNDSVLHDNNISESSYNQSQNQMRQFNEQQNDDLHIEEDIHHSRYTNWRTKILRFFKQTQLNRIDYEKPDNFFSQIIQDLGSSNIGFEQKGMKRYISGQRNQEIDDVPSKIPMFNCESPYLILWEILVYSFSIVYFFLIPLEIFFTATVRNHSLTQSFQCVVVVLLTLNLIQIHNTSVYIHGEFISNRFVILMKRVRSGQLAIDLMCLSIIIIDLALTNNQFPLFTLFFYLKIYTLAKFDKKFLNLIQLMRRMKASYLLIRLTLGIMFLCHIAACIYLKVGYYQLDHKQRSWITAQNTLDYKLSDQSFMIQFEWALYWSVTTILTVGYGDITPKAPNEVLVTIICMLVSCVIFAYCINSIWEILQDLKKKETKYLEIMNAINRYMRDKNVNTQLKLKICAYIQYYYKKQKSRDEGLEQVIISKLPPNLREELIYQSHIQIFEKVSWMKYFSEEFIKTLAFQIEEYHYPERDPIYCMGDDIDNELSTQGLYFLKEGTVECYIPYSEGKTDDAVFEYQIASENGYGVDTLKQQRKKNLGLPVKSLKKDIYLKHLVKDQYFGETSIFLNEQIPFSVKSLDFSTIYKISRKNFLDTIKKFPDDYEIYCEIKEKLEFRQKRAQYPKLKCDHCCRNREILNNEHQLIECPNVIPHLKQKNEDINFVDESNQSQKRKKFPQRSNLSKINCLSKLVEIQSLAKRAYNRLGNQMNDDGDMSIVTNNSMSFISQVSQGVIIENENESEWDEAEEMSPTREKRKNNARYLTITEELLTPKLQSTSNNEITISSKLFHQSDYSFNLKDESQDVINQEMQESKHQILNKQEKQERKLVNMMQQEEQDIQSYQSPKQILGQSERILSDQEDYNNNKGYRQAKQANEQPELMNSEEPRIHRNRKRIQSAIPRVESNNLMPSTTMLSSQRIGINTNTHQEQLTINNLLENQLIEFKQFIQSELNKHKATATATATIITPNPTTTTNIIAEKGQSQYLRHANTLPLIQQQQIDSPGVQNVNIQHVAIQNTQQNNNETQFIPDNNEINNDNNNNNNNNNNNDNPISIILDIDRMFKFRTYRRQFNYDIVIRKERERIKKLNHYHNQRRKTIKQKASLQFKVRKASQNSHELYGSHLRLNTSQIKDRTQSNVYLHIEQ